MKVHKIKGATLPLPFAPSPVCTHPALIQCAMLQTSRRCLSNGKRMDKVSRLSLSVRNHRAESAASRNNHPSEQPTLPGRMPSPDFLSQKRIKALFDCLRFVFPEWCWVLGDGCREILRKKCYFTRFTV